MVRTKDCLFTFKSQLAIKWIRSSKSVTILIKHYKNQFLTHTLELMKKLEPRVSQRRELNDL